MTDTALRFFRGATAPKDAVKGTIWFNTELNNIQICLGGDNWEKYGKVQDVVFDGSKLVIKKSDDTNVTLDFTDVASASGTTATFNVLKERLAGIDTRIDGVDDRIDGVDKTIADYKTEVASEFKDVADNFEAMNNMIGFTANGETDTVIKYVDAKVAEAASGATGELTEAVNGLDKKITDLTDDLNDEIERAGLAEKANSDAIAAEKARIDKLYAGSIEVDGEVIPDEGKSVRAIAAEEVALIVDGASESYDTLKEIADWIAAHPTDASEYNSRITKNTEDIAALTKTVGDNKTATDKAIEDLTKVVGDNKTAADGAIEALQGRATNLETFQTSATSRLDALEAHDEDYKGYTNDAIAALDSSFEAKTTAEGKVAVVTGIEIADGKIVEGEGKKTAKVDVYTVEKIDALFDAAIGNGGSVNDQITDALDELDFAGATVTPAKAGISVIANVTQENGKIAATAVEVEAAGAAKAAEDAAKLYVDGKDSAMNTRVAALETAKDDYKGADSALKSELEGKIAAAEAAAKKHTNDIVGELPKVEDQTQTVAQAIAAAEAAAKAYADQQVSGKNVTASGDDYVTAVAENNHITVTTNTSAIRDCIFVWDVFEE
jgi:hypothetical protein